MVRPLILTSVGIFVASLLTMSHYHSMQPIAGPTFSFGGISPQEQVAEAHLRKCGPVVFCVSFLVTIAGGFWINKTHQRAILWVGVGIIAGAVAFAIAAPQVPLTGPGAGADYAGRNVTMSDLRYDLSVGAVMGGLIGCLVTLLVAIVQRRLPWLESSR